MRVSLIIVSIKDRRIGLLQRLIPLVSYHWYPSLQETILSQESVIRLKKDETRP